VAITSDMLAGKPCQVADRPVYASSHRLGTASCSNDRGCDSHYHLDGTVAITILRNRTLAYDRDALQPSQLLTAPGSSPRSRSLPAAAAVAAAAMAALQCCELMRGNILFRLPAASDACMTAAHPEGCDRHQHELL
jgi:hypothetical protein